MSIFILSFLILFLSLYSSKNIVLNSFTSYTKEEYFSAKNTMHHLNIWPLPSSFTAGNTRMFISPHIEYSIEGTQSTRLVKAVDRYKKLFFSRGCSPSLQDTQRVLTSVNITVTQETEDSLPRHDMNEFYTLKVPDVAGEPIVIQAASSIGVLRALESLSQLIFPLEHVPNFIIREGCRNIASTLVIENAPLVISDSPTYPHRGLLLDTSRHYIPVQTIYKVLEGMAASKLNVFHWHIIDSQSFPLQSLALPLLSQKGAYSIYEVYTKQDIQDIIAFASDRGIRVIPELDMPGHTYSWHHGTGLIVCPNFQPWQEYCAEPPCGQLDLSRQETFDLVETLLLEVFDWFPESWIHLGSDEINTHCYLQDAGIQNYLKLNQMTLSDLLQKFQNHLQTLVKRGNKTLVLWEEALLNHNTTLPRNTIMQSWRNSQTTLDLLQKGHQVIVSDASAWYLDCGRGSFVSGNKSWCDPFKTWVQMYNKDVAKGIPLDLRKGILGGEGAMWTELVDENNLMEAVFPRVAAIAEALWTAPEERNWKQAASRLDNFIKYLGSRGIPSGPIWPTFCSQGACL